MDGLRLGFSGSRDGMTRHQRNEFAAWVAENKDVITSFTHGMCIGADEQAQAIVAELCGSVATGGVNFIGYPGFAKGHPARSRCKVNVENDVQAPMVRNRCIVNNVDMMIFAPKFPELKRSGTWATLRFARDSARVPVIVLAPWEYGDKPDGRKGMR